MNDPVRTKALEDSVPARKHQLARRILGLTLAVLLVISCGVLATPEPAAPAAADTPVPSETPTETPTPTPTPLPPVLSAGAVVPCLAGPGEAFETVVDLQAGEQAEIIGKSSGYWQVYTASGQQCWVADQGVTTEGEVALVPEIEAPPTPMPAAPPAPTGLQNVYSICTIDKKARPSRYINQFNLTWQDMSMNEDGFNVYRDGNLVGELPANSTQFSDNISAANNRPHYYYVVAYNAMGESKSDVLTLNCEGSGTNGGGGGGEGGGGGFGP